MRFLWIGIVAATISFSSAAAAYDSATADAAWAQIVESLKTSQNSSQVADELKAFYQKYPDHPKASGAWIKEQNLRQAAGGGSVAKSAGTPTTTAPVDNSFNGQLQQANARIKKAQQHSKEAALGEMERSGRKLADQFPKEPGGWQILLNAAAGFGGDKARQLYADIASRTPMADFKRTATTRLRELNAPVRAMGTGPMRPAGGTERQVSLKFSATDGRAVDISQMAGKVVLIDFWATWCGPCVAELPNVKKAYADFHDKGFEIIGVSFDNDIESLKRFVAENNMPWPQFCDGGGWHNAINKDFGINAIPAMYLVDKKGMIRDTYGRADLAKKIEVLLKED
jgi:peroxiredoxin